MTGARHIIKKTHPKCAAWQAASTGMSRAWILLTPLLLATTCAEDAPAAELVGSELAVEREPSALDCPDASGLARKVRALWMAPRTTERPLVIAVRFAHGDAGYSATIESSGAKSGTRQLTTSASTCASLADAVTVALALLLDMQPIARAAVPAGKEEAFPTRAQPTDHARRRANAPLEIALGAHAGAAFGAVGSALSGLFSVSALVERGRFGVEAHAFWSTPRSFGYPPGFVEVGLWGAALDGCFRHRAPANRALGFRPCAGLRVGRLSGHGSRFDANYDTTQPWFALAAGANLEMPLGARSRFEAGVSLLAPLTRHEFRVSGRGIAFESSALAFVGRIGTAFSIW